MHFRKSSAKDTGKKILKKLKDAASGAGRKKVGCFRFSCHQIMIIDMIMMVIVIVTMIIDMIMMVIVIVTMIVTIKME